MLLKNFTQNTWVEADDSGLEIFDAVNGKPISRISSSGIDFSGYVDYARTVGQRNLQSTSPHQRAAMLKELASSLLESKEIFYRLSTLTGATRRDSWVDIEGGIGTLFSYANLCERNITDRNVYIDGNAEPLSKSGGFIGQHILSPLQGVAVHINAYNFPVWGMLEKLAPCFIAGVPAVIKPATQTAFLTHKVFEHMVQTGILPEGSIQLICGSAGSLVDHLDYDDILCFTGSASTGAMLKSNTAFSERNARFNMEADSLNCCILGADVKADDAELNLFVREIVNELTMKAGQKCTAIRRVLVPEAMHDLVIEKITARLKKTIIGDPSSKLVHMGALAGLQQRDDVFKKLESLKADCEVVYGGNDTSNLQLHEADATIGAFMQPTVLSATNPDCTVAHDIEAFGPVCTVMPYRDTTHAIRLAKRGKGSLVASIVSSSPEQIEALALGIASNHGRILVLNQRSAEDSTGHGTVLPNLIHGGPGRAGGSEELGGLRGISHYMQLTALQAHSSDIARIVASS